MMRRKGFTLVELVVVILILGILAGVAAPKMFNTSAKATDNGLKQTLGIVRDAIELYQAQNGGALPSPITTGPDIINALKPYMRGSFPKSPVHGSAATAASVTITTGTTTANGSTGWMYNKDNGEFICNNTGMSATDGSVAYSAF
jgi:prepilin-type N-terminal cleavage/methylation domain-containing protein